MELQDIVLTLDPIEGFVLYLKLFLQVKFEIYIDFRTHFNYFSWIGSERFGTQYSDDDRDMGGVKQTGSHHYIILENLERDLCPVLMTAFIHEKTTITAQAYVFPCLSKEIYARGAIVADSRPNLTKICQYISNPNHFIISCSGR